MNIMHINSYYSDSKLYKNLFDKQIAQGLSLDVFVSIPINYQMPDRDFGDYTLVSKNHQKWHRIWYQYKQTKMLKDLKTHYQVKKYDLIHAHSLFTNGGLAYKLNQEYGIEYIVAVRNTDVNSFFKKMPHLRNYGVAIMEEAKKIIFISDTYKNLVLEKYIPVEKKEAIQNKMITIPNGIDQFWIDNRTEKRGTLQSKQVNIVYVGKIMKLKNVPMIAKACEILQDRGYDPKLTVVGQVLEQKEFDKIKSKPYVRYEPFMAMENIRELYQQQDIFVMPSHGETFGLVYVEAMSQGLPVIYTKGEGFDGQFPEGEVGYHVDPNNAADIADKIQLVMERYNEISKTSTKHAARYNWDTVADRYLSLYENVTK